MKTILSLSVLAPVLLLSACNSTKQASSVNDDVYFSPRNAPQEVYTPSQNKTSTQPSQSNPANTGNGPGNATRSESQYDYAENNARTGSDNGRTFDMDDYYDYSYAARIRRFNTTFTTGLGYYDPYYTNIYYYDYNPISFGTSVYTTYGFWNPGFTTMVYSRPFSWGLGFRQRMFWDPFGGWNSAWYGYDPFWSWNNPWNWSSPYYSCWNSPWYWYNGWGAWGGGWGNSYWNGFNHGYMNGYWNGYYHGLANSMYFNSFDRNQFYYGPRNAIGNNGVSSGGRRGSMSFGEKYQRALAVDRGDVQPIKMSEDGIRTPVIRGNQGNIKQEHQPTLSPSIKEDIKSPSLPSRDVRSPKSPENAITPAVKPNSNFDYLPPSKTPETNNPVKTPQGTLSPSFDTRTDKPSMVPSTAPTRNNFDQINPGVRNDKTPDFIPENNPRNRFNNNSRRQEFMRDFSKPQTPADFDREQVRPRIENTPRYESPRDYSPRYQSPGMENSPRNFDTPRMESSPRNYDTPRMESSPRNFDTPRMESSPRNYDTPRMENSPRNFDSPRSQPSPRMDMSPRNFHAPRMQSSPRMESSPRMQSSPRNFSPSVPGGRGGSRR